MAQTQQQKPQITNNHFSHSCEKCAHVKVCAVFRAVAPLLENWKEHKPFEATELAQICQEYFPESALQYLRAG